MYDLAKIAWVFPGQGAQTVGMGLNLYHRFPEAKAVLDTAANVLGSDFLRIMFHGPSQELVLTKNAQPALVAVGVALAEIAKSRGLIPDMLSGLSLGEYTALVVAESLGFEDALRLTRRRGIYMQDACPPEHGAMAAVLGLACAEVESICYDAKRYGVVTPANYNCPGQTVISGEKKAVGVVVERLLNMGAKCVPLSVSAPFHCALMEPAAKKLAKDLDGVLINAPRIPVYCNAYGEKVETPNAVKEALIKQVTFPVLWQVDVEAMIEDGARTFVEMGPGKSLTGFLKRINPKAKGITFYEPDDLAMLLGLKKEA